MKSVTEIVSVIREQVKLGIFESEKEGVEEYKIMREMKIK